MQETVRVERYADQGRCVGHIDGRVVFIRFALPGELVVIELDEPHNRNERFLTGEVVKVLEASPERVEPVWPLAGPLAWGGGVGGADLVHVSLEGQLQWKATVIAEQMKRLGSQDVEVPIERMRGDIALEGLHWRTRIEMVADEHGKASMRRRGTHVRVPIDTMPLATQHLLQIAADNNVFDRTYEPGAQIRVAAPEARSGKRLRDNFAVLVNGKLAAGSHELTELVPFDDTMFSYRVAAEGFWQVHRQAPLALPQYVIELVRRALNGATKATIWDLYSGSGLFTLPLSMFAAQQVRMFSVEGSKTAVRHAIKNIKHAGLHDIDAQCGDVAKTLERQQSHPDVVVLDPPRAGAKAKVCQQIIHSGARAVVYIACDPTSLARDTATLTREGFELKDIRAFDIYPMTHHVETVALFVRA